jgi:glycine/D-amino acid oxidase-like deaminating enzyme/nitrite reductase/ring-hydroxylating ferredoxin subunit
MDTSSLWQGTAARTACLPTLQTDLKVDVAIVGGGITGLSAAMLLVDAGKRVAVLDAHKVGNGSTGNSTGNLYATLDLGLHALEQAHGAGVVRQVVASRGAAIDLIESTIGRFGMDCGFQRVPWHLVAADAAHVGEIEQEAATATRAGLDAELVDSIVLPVPCARALRVQGQAQFQPLAYLRQLAQRIGSEDCLIFENTRVLAVDDAAGLVRTEHGSVHAQHIILATHSPVGIHLVQSQLEVVREYGIAAPSHDAGPAPGVYWCVGRERHSLRGFTEHGRSYLVAVGSAHPTGDPDIGRDRYQHLEQYARAHFQTGPVEYRWSAQRYRARDKLPFIGRNVDAAHTYIATGFSGDGLTYGTLAGMLLADEILGRDNPWRALYRVERLAQDKRPEGFEHENTGPAQPGPAPALDAGQQAGLGDLGACQARKIEVDGQPVAVYRTADGALRAVAGKCSHMGCEINWNDAERSWDCNCHGSRFAPDGSVLEGPALAPLQAAALDPDNA